MRRKLTLPGLAAILLIGFVVERLWVTDSERIQAWGEDAAAALMDRDRAALGALLHEDFTLGERDREATLDWVLGLHARYRPTRVEIALGEIEFEGDVARVFGQVITGIAGRPVRAGGQMVFEKGAEGWLLRSVALEGLPR